MKKTSSNEFKIKFGVRPNEINVHTLLKSLTNISAIIDEVNNEVGTGNKIEVKIKALEKGSFLVHIGLSEAEITLLSGLSIKAIETIIKVMSELFTLRKELKRGEPTQITESGDNFQIKTKSGNTITVNKQTFNIYNINTKVNEAISDTFQTLTDDSAIKSFEIDDKKERPIFDAERKDFNDMSVRQEIDKPDKRIKIEKQFATLYALKLVFDNKKRRWEFYYHGNQISAIITDVKFFKSVDKGERFGKGSSFEVELEITKQFNSSVNTYVITNYEITNVIKHIPRPDDQSNIEFPS